MAKAKKVVDAQDAKNTSLTEFLGLPVLTDAEQEELLSEIIEWTESIDEDAPHGYFPDGRRRLVAPLPLNMNPFVSQEALAVLGEKEVRRRMAAAKLAPSKPKKEWDGNRNALDSLS